MMAISMLQTLAEMYVAVARGEGIGAPRPLAGTAELGGGSVQPHLL
jgi:hypothetical protein